jgi:hypothetical protein
MRHRDGPKKKETGPAYYREEKRLDEKDSIPAAPFHTAVFTSAD